MLAAAEMDAVAVLDYLHGVGAHTSVTNGRQTQTVLHTAAGMVYAELYRALSDLRCRQIDVLQAHSGHHRRQHHLLNCGYHTSRFPINGHVTILTTLCDSIISIWRCACSTLGFGARVHT